MSRSRGKFVETWEGLGLDLVSDWKSNVSSRSHAIGSRLQANMHSFLLHCKTAHTSFWMQWVYIVYGFTSYSLIYIPVAHIWNCNAVHNSKEILFLNFANAKSLTTPSKSTERSMSASMQSRDRESNLCWPIDRCSVRVLDSSEYSVHTLMVSVALYCLLRIVLQHSNIIFLFFFGGGATVCKTVRPILSDRCLSVCHALSCLSCL